MASYLTPAAQTDAAALAQAAADFADAYFSAIGRDPAALSEAEKAQRTSLVDRYQAWRLASGGDGAAVQARRDALVQAVRAAQALPPLPAAELAAAYSASLAQFAGLAPQRQAQIADDLLDTVFVQAYLAPGRPYAALWAAAAAQAGTDRRCLTARRWRVCATRCCLQNSTSAAAGRRWCRPASVARATPPTPWASWPPTWPGWAPASPLPATLTWWPSGVQTAQGGHITLLAPGGQINVGLPSDVPVPPDRLRGAIAYTQGNVSAFSDGDFQVNSQRVFVVGQGNLTVWSSTGDIDAGRGANTAVTIPPLVARRQADGSLSFELPSISTGSGIGIVRPAVGEAKGDIGLYAPNGEVLALDAQIRAPGRITLAAEVVRGADNISGGSVVGSAVVVPTVSVAVPTESSAATQAQAAGAGAAAAAAGQPGTQFAAAAGTAGPGAGKTSPAAKARCRRSAHSAEGSPRVAGESCRIYPCNLPARTAALNGHNFINAWVRRYAVSEPVLPLLAAPGCDLPSLL